MENKMIKEEPPKFSIVSHNAEKINTDLLFEKYKPTEEDLKNNYNAFSIQKIQYYNPIFSCFFDINSENIDNTTIYHEYSFLDMDTIVNTKDPSKKISKPLFVKFSPLLDPIHYMIGKYNVDSDEIRTLPGINSNCLAKINHVHNTAYVDGFFSYLSSQLQSTHHIFHGIEYYGSYVCLQDKFKMNIADDLEYLNNSNFFISNVNKLFTISSEDETPFLNGGGSRNNRPKIAIQNTKHNLSEISIVEIDDIITDSIIPVDASCNENELIYEKDIQNDNVSEYSSSSEDSSVEDEDEVESIIEESSDSNEDKEGKESDEETEEDDESESDNSDSSEEAEPQIFAYINNFPTQMICLEKCENTIDQLFLKGDIDESEGASALFQIIMTLIIYQKAFHFTHNDLHTNNIMYINTDIEYLHYEYNNKKYRVPTYGRIYKIIDFGRSIYKFQNHLFCSDSFMPGGDASTQYNFGPFFNEKKPRLDPNYSFDLCRLGCSIYDFIIEDDDEYRDLDDFQKLIYKWCLDDNNKSVLYKKNGEERYKDFKLYKMIARTVHNHVPHDQLDEPLFDGYQITMKQWNKLKPEQKIHYLNIDDIPCYV